MEQQRSSLYRLIDRQMGGTLVEYVSARRPYQSWRAIAKQLSDQLGVEVSHESLRGWFPDPAEQPADVAS